MFRQPRSIFAVLTACFAAMLFCDTASAQLFKARRACHRFCTSPPQCCPQPTCTPPVTTSCNATSYRLTPATDCTTLTETADRQSLGTRRIAEIDASAGTAEVLDVSYHTCAGTQRLKRTKKKKYGVTYYSWQPQRYNIFTKQYEDCGASSYEKGSACTQLFTVCY